MNEEFRLIVYFFIGLITCFISFSGWLTIRDKKNMESAEWKGRVDTKLDKIIDIKTDVDILKKSFNEHDVKIAEHSRDLKTVFNEINDLKGNEKK